MNMKKNTSVLLAKVIYSLFIMATIIALIAVYKNIENPVSTNFLLGYVLFAVLMVIYIPIITIVNARNFTWNQIRKRIVKFTSLLILFTAVNYCFDYIVLPTEIDLLKNASTGLGVSFGIAFFDIVFSKNKTTAKIIKGTANEKN